MTGYIYPLYSTAVIVPVLAFPAWILCLHPLYWHYSQRNIAAGSLILWMSMLNFFNSINPLIWPRDNLLEWWNGNVLCDIEVHVKVCAVVALTSCAAVIARKLARVMDTTNITVAPSRSSRIKEKGFEIWWCWGFPLVLMGFYYIVQPSRYFIFAISGCVAAYDTSWPSIVVSWMWGPITSLVGAVYAGKFHTHDRLKQCSNMHCRYSHSPSFPIPPRVPSSDIRSQYHQVPLLAPLLHGPPFHHPIPPVQHLYSLCTREHRQGPL